MSTSRKAAILLAAMALGVGCTHPRPAAGPADAVPLVGAERRPARAAASPADEVAVPVPAGATRAVVHVAAVERALPWPRKAVVVAESRGSAANGFVSGAATGKAWARLDLPLAAGVTGLALHSPAPGRTERLWWSVRFEGLAPPGARNILLVSIDTVRADAVGCVGQKLATTPNLDALAARSTLFTQAVSAAPWTLPSHVSVMTGVLPSWHGRTDPLRLDKDLPPLPTLATILGEHGYETAAFTGSGSISWALGTTRGFQLVVEHEPTRANHWWRSEDAECVRGAKDVVAWLEDRSKRDGPSPFFLFWHTYEPHFPYHDGRFLGTKAPLPPGVAEDAREDWLRYLGDLAKADSCLGGILDALDRLGLRETTDVVVMSDHGEEFGEHSNGVREERTRHGNGLWDLQLRVPLVVASPSIPPGRRDEQVTLLDVFPTILAFAGVDAPASAQGRMLQVPGGEERVAAEALYPKYVTAEQKALREKGGLKYVATLSKPPAEALVDVAADPLEEHDLAHDHAAETERLRRATVELFASAPAATALRGGKPGATGEGLDPAVLESLRALGYVK